MGDWAQDLPQMAHFNFGGLPSLSALPVRMHGAGEPPLKKRRRHSGGPEGVLNDHLDRMSSLKCGAGGGGGGGGGGDTAGGMPLRQRRSPENMTHVGWQEGGRKDIRHAELRTLYREYLHFKQVLERSQKSTQTDATVGDDVKDAFFSLINSSRGGLTVQRLAAELIPRYVGRCPSGLQAGSRVVLNLCDWAASQMSHRPGSEESNLLLQTAKAAFGGLPELLSTAVSVNLHRAIIPPMVCTVVVDDIIFCLLHHFDGCRLAVAPREPNCTSKESFPRVDEAEVENTARLSSSVGNPAEQPVSLSSDTGLTRKGIEVVSKKGTEVPLLTINSSQLLVEGTVTQKLVAVALIRALRAQPEAVFGACFGALRSKDAHRRKEAVYFLLEVTRSNLQSVNLNSKEGTPSEYGGEVNTSALNYITHTTNAASTANAMDMTNATNTTNTTNATNGEQDGGTGSDANQELRKSPPCQSNYSIAQHALEGKPTAQHSLVTSLQQLRRTAMSEVLAPIWPPLQALVAFFFGPDTLSPLTSHDGDGRSWVREREAITTGTIIGEDSPPLWASSRGRVSWPVDGGVELNDMGDTVRRRPSWTSQRIGAWADPGDDQPVLPTSHMVHSTGLTPGVLFQQTAQQLLRGAEHDAPEDEVCMASRHLWIGPIDLEVGETALRAQFDKFGPIEGIVMLRGRESAVVDYCTVRDAVRARETLQGSLHWGRPLQLHFADNGTSTIGLHVWVGGVSSQSAKEELLRSMASAQVPAPCSVSVLVSASAVLLEFTTGEDARRAFLHLRELKRKPFASVPPAAPLILPLPLPLSGLPLIAKHGDRNMGVGARHLWVGRIDPLVREEDILAAFAQHGELTGWKFLRHSGCCFIDFRTADGAAVAKARLNGVRFGSMAIHVEYKNVPSHLPARTATTSPPHPPSLLHTPPLAPLGNRLLGTSSPLAASLSSLTAKSALNSPGLGRGRGRSLTTREHGERERVPTNTLWMGLPDHSGPGSPGSLSEIELRSIFNSGAAGLGSVTRVRSARTARGPCRFIEFDRVEAAAAALRNVILAGHFDPNVQIEFSNSALSLQQSEQHANSGQITLEDIRRRAWDYQRERDRRAGGVTGLNNLRSTRDWEWEGDRNEDGTGAHGFGGTVGSETDGHSLGQTGNSHWNMGPDSCLESDQRLRRGEELGGSGRDFEVRGNSDIREELSSARVEGGNMTMTGLVDPSPSSGVLSGLGSLASPVLHRRPPPDRGLLLNLPSNRPPLPPPQASLAPLPLPKSSRPLPERSTGLSVWPSLSPVGPTTNNSSQQTYSPIGRPILDGVLSSSSHNIPTSIAPGASVSSSLLERTRGFRVVRPPLNPLMMKPVPEPELVVSQPAMDIDTPPLPPLPPSSPPPPPPTEPPPPPPPQSPPPPSPPTQQPPPPPPPPLSPPPPCPPYSPSAEAQTQALEPQPPLPAPVSEPQRHMNLGVGVPAEPRFWLCKSGHQYCGVEVVYQDTALCRYDTAIHEPAGWPEKLQVTKRADYRAVQSTFRSTPSNQREVCRIYATLGDTNLAGFDQFVAYLKERDRAGVIKIPSGGTLWPRMLYVMPWNQDACDMLGISFQPDTCLLGLTLPSLATLGTT